MAPSQSQCKSQCSHNAVEKRTIDTIHRRHDQSNPIVTKPHPRVRSLKVIHIEGAISQNMR